MSQIKLFLALLVFLPVLSQSDDNMRANPEKYIGKARLTQIAEGKNFMAVTSEPLATKAAYEVLENDGTAADAAIAAQLVLGLTEPQSSGLGGGAFAIYYDAKHKSISSIDGREAAPYSVDEDYFIKDSGDPMTFYEAVLNGKSVGVPGTPALLGLLHEKYGSKELESLIAPAYDLAINGFKPSAALEIAIRSDIGKLDKHISTRDYFFRQKHLFKNKDYGSLLKKFAKDGYMIFYKDPISTNIINAVNQKNGVLSQRDFNDYRVIIRTPVCDYFIKHKICSMGEPSSGALTILQILKMIEHNPSWHNYIEASKLAFADRNYFMADPDYVLSPGIKLLDDEYILNRRLIINSDTVLNSVTNGQPSSWGNNFQYENIGYEEKGTTHISIIDKFGNIISMTSTIENSFGSRIMANGYLLNNELTDFSFVAKKYGKPVANRIEGGKRPRSSMSPTIVFSKNDLPMLIIGSAGGSRIIGHVTQRIIDVLHNKKSLRETIENHHILNRGSVTEAEGKNSIVKKLIEKGHKVTITDIASGLNGIYIDPQTHLITGVSDPRRIGIPMGK